jgi:nucleotide-binding universal stress UspA family protein
MYRIALIALDHSTAEGPMLDCLSDLRAMGVERVVLTHVIRVGYAQGAGYGHEQEYRIWLEGRSTPLREAGLDVAIDIRASGVPAMAILEAAAEHHADLIVVGSRGQSMFRGLFLGSTAREVIRLSSLPVRLEWIEAGMKAGETHCERVCHGGLGPLLLATDLSPHAAAAEAAAVALAAKAGSIHLVHVVTKPDLARSPYWPAMARAALEVIAQDVAAAGGAAETHLPHGEASAEIARLAAERGAQLIIVGKHGQGWVRSLVTGSTAAALCEIARRPVLMVPLPEREA